MAMNLPLGGGDEPEVMMEINTTPLIDVLLVLLVMFIITIPIQLHAVNIQLPTGASPPPSDEPQVVRIDLDAEGRVQWDGEPLSDAAALQQRLQASAAQPVTPELHVRAHADAPYGAVAAVLAAAQRQGLKKLGLLDS
jgi:biopolymer transport protein ExbD